MAYSAYDKINGKYAEVEILASKQKALFFDGRIQRKDIPSGFYIYDIRHSDEDWGEPYEINHRTAVNYFGTIITYKPIKLDVDDYAEIDGLKEFVYTDRYFEPSAVGEWIRDMRGTDNHSEEVSVFCNKFIRTACNCGVEWDALRNLFMAGYCYYFAMMLKAAFNRGEVYIAAPYGHVVWRDIDNRYYDIEGEYVGDAEAMIPVTDPFCSIKDFKHLGDKDHLGASNEQIKFLIKKYYDKFPNA